uniref:Large ribosomal subunit protein uL14c n=1 Tax=Hypertelis spergulacea TaxID=764270 RepID=A0A411L8W5_9CARY|nr:ribosomal protein L14 [Hypertelis spergulacea]
MVQTQTLVNVADNSGARALMCIRIIGAGNRRYARLGDVIVAVIKGVTPTAKLEKSQVVRAVLVRTRKELKRDSGMILRYDENAAVILDPAKAKLKAKGKKARRLGKGKPKATRVLGMIPWELRQKFPKIVSLAPDVL